MADGREFHLLSELAIGRMSRDKVVVASVLKLFQRRQRLVNHLADIRFA